MPYLQRRGQSIAAAITAGASICCVLAGCSVIGGWLLDIPLLKSISPSWVTMQPNGAICFVLAGLSLWALRMPLASPRGRRIGQGCAIVVTLIAMLTLAEYGFQQDFGIDQFLFSDTAPLEALAPGRMSPVAALCLVLIGLALLGLEGHTSRTRRLTHSLPLLTASCGLFAFGGYLYRAQPVEAGFALLAPMALHTAVLFIVLSLGVLSARLDRGLPMLLLGTGAGSFMARRLLPMALYLPVLVGWVRLAGQRAGFYSTETGVALFATSLAIILVLFIWHTGLSLNGVETARNAERDRAETERSVLGQLLDDQQFYARSLIESTVDALITTDPDGLIADVNAQAEVLTGRARTELIGTPFKNYFTDPDRAEAGIRRALIGERLTDYELTACARDGLMTVVSFNATTFNDRQDRLQGVFAAARDVTDRTRLEQALRQKNAELEDATRMKSEFLSNMSHELRTPLNAIIGFSEVLKDGLMGELPKRQHAFVSDIFASGRHLLSLINDILDLSKIEAGKMSLDLEAVEVSSLFLDSLSVFREEASARRIHLDMNLHQAPGSIRVDPRKVKQIVYNMLSNGIKFTLNGGMVTLRVSRVPRAEVGRPLAAWQGRGFPLADSVYAEFLQIDVTDSGIGIAPDGLARLFAPFSQIDTGLARRFDGTGLGLAMVKHLAELHEGTVAVASAVGDGSCFTVWLPLRRAPRTAGTRASAGSGATNAAAEAPVALVVEDGTKSAALIRLHLEAEGFAVRHASSGDAALALAAQQPLSLIALDSVLPDMDAWKFLSRIKQMPVRRTPVVIFSIVPDGASGFALGAAAVLQKPVSRHDFYEAFNGLGLLSAEPGRPRTILLVDDGPTAADLLASVLGPDGTVLRASGHEAIDVARRELPAAIVLDLRTPDVRAFDVAEALRQQAGTAGIPILILTDAEMSAAGRAGPGGHTGIEKPALDVERFAAEVRRAMSGRRLTVGSLA